MQTSYRPASEIAPLSRERASQVAHAEARAFADLVADLDDAEWRLATQSTDWNIHEMVAHVSAQYEELTRFGTFSRRMREARRRYPDMVVVDAHSRVQLDEIGGRQPHEIRAHLDEYTEKAIRSIRRMPWFLRQVPTSRFFPEPPLPERGLGYLVDVIAPRDTWMHRLEITRATGHEFLMGAHDREIVAQAVRDLDREWDGPPLILELTGAAGGTYALGRPAAETEAFEADALEFMLHLSGREGLDLPPDHPLFEARVVF